ncbi:hypothetical protein HC928_00835 [bacterium]|nr:hypothetical protein [bacterium]
MQVTLLLSKLTRALEDDSEVIRMSGLPKQISASMFGGILFCFLLPFVFASCRGTTFNLSGIELALGTTIDSNAQQIDPVIEVQLVFVCALAGLVVSFLTFQLRQYVIMGLSVVGAILLLVFKVRIDAESRQAAGFITIGMSYGFWLSLLLFLSIIGLSGYVLYQSRSSPLVEDYL